MKNASGGCGGGAATADGSLDAGSLLLVLSPVDAGCGRGTGGSVGGVSWRPATDTNVVWPPLPPCVPVAPYCALPFFFLLLFPLSRVAGAQLVPFSTLNGRILGHASTLTRFFCKPGSRTPDAALAAGTAWRPPVFDDAPDLGPGALVMDGRFMYDEDARLLLLRTTLGGSPAWFGYAFGPHEGARPAGGLAGAAEGEVGGGTRGTLRATTRPRRAARAWRGRWWRRRGGSASAPRGGCGA